MPETAAATLTGVLLDLDDTLLPWQTLPHWQWAWRPRGPVLSERHVVAALHRSLHAWDRRRWQGLVGEAPALDAAAYRDHLIATLTEIAGHSLPPEEVTAVVQRFLKPAGEVETFPDVVPALAHLAASGVRVGVTTSLPADAARYALHRAGLRDLQVVAYGDGPAPGLPSPAAYRAAAQAIDRKPKEVLFLGDLFWSDVRAAARAGLHAVLVDRRDWSPRVLARRIRTLAEVGGLLAGPPPAAPLPSQDGEGPGDAPPSPPSAPVERKV